MAHENNLPSIITEQSVVVINTPQSDMLSSAHTKFRCGGHKQNDYTCLDITVIHVLKLCCF